MRIVEQFTQGKFDDPNRNEDRIIVTENFIAVLDGATAKKCGLLDGKTSGRFAVDTAEKVFKEFSADVSAEEAVDALSRELDHRIAQFGDFSQDIERPAYGFAAYSRHRRQIWRVNDVHVRMDDINHLGSKVVDDITYAARALMTDMALRGGMTVDDIRQKDVGREFIQPALDLQHLLANRPGEYCFGVIDGRRVPRDFIEVLDASTVTEITLASDGYPDLLPTLAQTEKYLFDYMIEDPLLYKKHKSAKGVSTGQVSYDDRAYIRFTP